MIVINQPTPPSPAVRLATESVVVFDRCQFLVLFSISIFFLHFFIRFSCSLNILSGFLMAFECVLNEIKNRIN